MTFYHKILIITIYTVLKIVIGDERQATFLLAKKDNDKFKAFCVTSGDGAITWLSTNIEKTYTIDEGQYHNINYNNVDENIRNYSLSFPKILDYRWEKFDIYTNDTDYQSINNTKFIHISVQCNEEVVIKLTDSNNIEYCAKIKNDRAEDEFVECKVEKNSCNQINSVSENEDEDSTNSPDESACKEDNEKVYSSTSEFTPEWAHYTIYKHENRIFVKKQFTLPEDESNYQQLDYKLYLDAKFAMKWKLHRTSAYNIPSKILSQSEYGFQLTSSPLSVAGNRLCLEFYIYFYNIANITITLNMTNEDGKQITVEINRSNEWQRIVIEEHIHPTKKHFHIFINSSSKYNDGYILIDKFLQCNDKPRIISMSSSNKSSLICQNLKSERIDMQQKQDNFLKDIYMKRLNNDSKLSCKNIVSNDYCENYEICDEDQCHCSIGKVGDNCDEDCTDDGHWGKDCNSTCSENCKNKKCDKVNGYCTEGCLDGFIGNRCLISDIVKVYENSIEVHSSHTNYTIIKELYYNGFYEGNNFMRLKILTNYTINLILCKDNICLDDEYKAEKRTGCIPLTEYKCKIEPKKDALIIKIKENDKNSCPLKMYNIFLNNKLASIDEKSWIRNLEASMNYTVEFQPNNTLKQFEIESFNINTTTLYAQPTFNTIESTNSTISITLNNSNKDSSLKFKVEYKLIKHLMCSNNKSDSENIKSEKFENLKVELKNLSPYSMYEISILTENRKTETLRSYINTTAFDKIYDSESTPNSYNLTNNNTIIYEMRPCDEYNGPTEYYFYASKENSKSLPLLNTNQELKIIELKNLEPYTEYVLLVQAIRLSSSRNGLVRDYEFRTSPAAPSKILNFTLYRFNNESIFFKWKPPNPANGELESYSINILQNERNASSEPHKKCFLYPDYICGQLRYDPQRNQTLKIQAKNKDPNNLGDVFETAITTDMTVGPTKPLDVQRTYIESNIVNLTWYHPELENGQIESFEILIKNLANNINYTKIIDINERQYSYAYKVDSLEDGYYNISIRAKNQFKVGDNSEWITTNITSTATFVVVNTVDAVVVADKEEPKSNVNIIVITILIISVVVLLGISVIVYYKYIYLRKKNNLDQQLEIAKLPEEIRMVNLESEEYMNNVEHEFEMAKKSFPYTKQAGQENKHKNRYGNIIPYDRTRVVLKSNVNYINANYIEGYKGSKTFIATQCPLKSTINDFWEMIWQEKCSIIVCLASLSEGPRKVMQYWPIDQETWTCFDITVEHVETLHFVDFYIRKILISLNKETREIYQYYFFAWPDNEIPIAVKSLYYFINYIKQKDDQKFPLVVHCSAGVGRTGAFIAIYNLLNDNTQLELPQYLTTMRQCRANLISSVDQYKLVYFVLHELKHGKDTRFHWQYIKDIDKDTLYKLIFKGKGIYYLPRYPIHEEFSDYINAVKVNGFQKKDKFIATQQPFINNETDTCSDFWRMIVAEQAPLILSLQDINTNIPGSCAFWPSSKKPYNPVDFIQVTFKSKENKGFYDVYNLQVLDIESENKFTTTLVQFIGWENTQLCPNSLSNFYEFHQTYSSLRDLIVICCFDGVTGCGVFAALDFLIKKLDTEKNVDVCWAALAILNRREEFLQYEEQYIFLYNLAKHHIVTKDFQEEDVYENVFSVKNNLQLNN